MDCGDYQVIAIVRATDCGDYLVIGNVRAIECGDCLVIGIVQTIDFGDGMNWICSDKRFQRLSTSIQQQLELCNQFMPRAF